MKNKQRRILWNITFKNLLRSRNIIVLVAIALTTILFTSIATVGFSLLESFQQQTLRLGNNSSHGAIMYITEEQATVIEEQKNYYKKIGNQKIITNDIESESISKYSVAMVCMDENARKFTFSDPSVGSAPSKSNEIALDLTILKCLGIEPKVGAIVPLKYKVHGQTYNSSFILSGYWEGNILSDISFMLVSESFVQDNFQNVKCTYSENSDTFGVIHAYIKFDNDRNIESKLNSLVVATGLNNLQYNYNWAYVGSSLNLDFKFVLSMLVCLLLIVFTGYLVINNIFQISVVNDIHFYGLLKTIGFTNAQIKKMLVFEAFLMSCVGIVLGEIAGYIVGLKLFPIIMTMTNISIIEFSASPIIFLLAAIFTFITVFISVNKPGKIAGRVSPVEATRF